MNPFRLSASDMLVWGIVLHLIADWLFQSNWMATNKMKWLHYEVDLYGWRVSIVTLHPAGYVHATIHGICLSLIFGWVALPLALTHLFIDTRKPVLWWTKTFGHTKPWGNDVKIEIKDEDLTYEQLARRVRVGEQIHTKTVPLYDIGTEVQIWVDQVFHIVLVAVAALLVHL